MEKNRNQGFLYGVLLLVGFLVLLGVKVECRKVKWAVGDVAPACRAQSVSIAEFGGVGDGATVNTIAFQKAINHLSEYSDKGGGQLYIPPGKWVTGSINLTNHFTLYLHKHAVILGSQDPADWPFIPPLPSYGIGRDGGHLRYSSLINGYNLTDVVITGDNGTIDGQGAIWWEKFHQKKLKNTRGYMVELMHSKDIIISNLTFINSPNWNLHPVYSSNIFIHHVTILAPLRSPNTDGIDPDSCSYVRIEDCYVESGDDIIAIKSGWDEAGYKYGMPSQHIVIRRVVGVSPTSAILALGSEMSGGIQDVHAEDIEAINSEAGVRIKSTPGRGGFVRDIYVSGMKMVNMRWAFTTTGSYGDHPEGKFDPKALPVVERIGISNVIALNVSIAGKMEGIPQAPYKNFCFTNITMTMAKSKHPAWNCTSVEGFSSNVTPEPCELLQIKPTGTEAFCGPQRFEIPEQTNLKPCKSVDPLN
uniref:Rhamnogalacturonase A/B/Epimerase-like pectate lyase domain-containing protein n=1 Tax=Araucaria cunninghamii TaxID=56994 RepID=A0A0D6QY48_ARACU